MPVKSQHLLNAPLAFWLAEMQNKLLGEFIKANIWTKKFNESLWGLVNEVCGALKGLLNMLVPKELCLSLPLFSFCASSLHNGAKPLRKFGLTNPKSAVPRGKAEWEGSVCPWHVPEVGSPPAAHCEQTTVDKCAGGDLVPELLEVLNWKR